MHFSSLKHACYHRVSAAPNEPRTHELVLSDIVLHLPVLEYYASLCDSVTEFGVRGGESTVALIAGCRGVMHSFDICHSPIVDVLNGCELPCKWSFQTLDTGSEQDNELVKETDLLLIDTLHTYEHVTKELRLHGRKAKRFIAFHDTFTCGEVDVSGSDPLARGILPAINEFLQKFPGEYKTVYRTNACNGLWVVERMYI